MTRLMGILVASALIIQLLAVSVESASLPCAKKLFPNGGVVCVCNSTYCDYLERLEAIPEGEYILFTSTQNGDRFRSIKGSFSKDVSVGVAVDENLELMIYRRNQYQSIIGFGGAFTDASGVNIVQHSPEFQDTIIEQYFGGNGLEYNIGRVPMGGADFSTRGYTYDDIEGDITLDNFALTPEDHQYKIRKALEKKSDLKLFASVWTAPKWMKSNKELFGIGFLEEEFYSLWADYFIRFLEEYSKEGLEFWSISTQNEPLHGSIFNFGFNCMGWTAEQQRIWIKEHLGPKLSQSKYKDITLIMYDDQRLHLKNYTDVILGDPDAAKYISGIGVHWYTDGFVPSNVLSDTHAKFPNYFLLGTEACAGAMPFGEPDVILGSWSRAVNYASDIITDLNNFVSGWIDWNLVLDIQGGPNWRDNFVDAPMISMNRDEIYKQPIYYAMGHFSKFIPENSTRINHRKLKDGITGQFSGLDVLTCLRPDGSVSVVFLNRLNQVRKIRITDSENGHESFDILLAAKSISTLVYNGGDIPERDQVTHESSSSMVNYSLLCTIIIMLSPIIFIQT